MAQYEDLDLDAIQTALEPVIPEGGRYVLVLVTPTRLPNGAEGSRVRTASTVAKESMVQLLSDVLENLARKYAGGNVQTAAELAAVPLKTKERMFELLEAVIGGSEKYGIPRAAWRDLLLIWSSQMAHDAGLTKEAFLAAALETVTEEWSTPNTEGRMAVSKLVNNLAPKGQG